MRSTACPASEWAAPLHRDPAALTFCCFVRYLLRCHLTISAASAGSGGAGGVLLVTRAGRCCCRPARRNGHCAAKAQGQGAPARVQLQVHALSSKLPRPSRQLTPSGCRAHGSTECSQTKCLRLARRISSTIVASDAISNGPPLDASAVCALRLDSDRAPLLL